jgi:hypothetical protein
MTPWHGISYSVLRLSAKNTMWRTMLIRHAKYSSCRSMRSQLGAGRSSITARTIGHRNLRRTKTRRASNGSHSRNSHPATPASTSTNAAYTPVVAGGQHTPMYACIQAHARVCSTSDAGDVQSWAIAGVSDGGQGGERLARAARRGSFSPLPPLYVRSSALLHARLGLGYWLGSARFLLYRRETRHGVATWLQLSNTKQLELIVCRQEVARTIQ